MDKENLNCPKNKLVCFCEVPQFPTCSKIDSIKTTNNSLLTPLSAEEKPEENKHPT